MTTADGRVAVTYNGEIYNAQELRAELMAEGVPFHSRCDTEVLLNAYAQWGEERSLDRLYGMFSFAIWDTRAVPQGGKPRLFAAVDHVGMKPLYWHCERGTLTLSSTADALRACVDQRLLPEALGLCHVLSLGYCPAPSSVWRGVYKLAPGELLRWSPGEALPETRSWWTPPSESSSATSVADACAHFSHLFPLVLKQHLASDVPVSLLLSAGLDSSTIACCLAEQNERTACVTLALNGEHDESRIAAEAARALGMPHIVARLSVPDIDLVMHEVGVAFDEPQGFGALLTMMKAAEAARSCGKVVLSGDGGDEAFGGYTWHRAPDQSTSCFVRDHLHNVMPRFTPAEAKQLLGPLEPTYDESEYSSWLDSADRASLPPVRRRQRLDWRGFCAGSIVPKLDRATMAYGLELRAPFLDRRILDWAMALPMMPDEMKIVSSKPVLREFLNTRAMQPVLTRPKQGFSLRLGRADLFTSMLDSLSDTRLCRDGLLCARWRDCVGPAAPNREGRAFMLRMLAEWWEVRA